MSAWLGIDHGSRRVGIAAGQTDPSMATPIKSIPAEPLGKCLEEIASLARQYGATGLVVGEPVNMDGTRGPQAEMALQFAISLAESTGLDVRMWDERLSSFAADKALAGRLTRMKRRAVQDAIAAATILQEFLDNDGPATAERVGGK